MQIGEISRPGHRYNEAASSKWYLVWDPERWSDGKQKLWNKNEFQGSLLTVYQLTSICRGWTVRACKALFKVREWLELCFNGAQRKLVIFVRKQKKVKHAGAKGRWTTQECLPGKPPPAGQQLLEGDYTGMQQAWEDLQKLKHSLEPKYLHIWHTSCKRRLLQVLIPLKQRSRVSKGPAPTHPHHNLLISEMKCYQLFLVICKGISKIGFSQKCSCQKGTVTWRTTGKCQVLPKTDSRTDPWGSWNKASPKPKGHGYHMSGPTAFIKAEAKHQAKTYAVGEAFRPGW